MRTLFIAMLATLLLPIAGWAQAYEIDQQEQFVCIEGEDEARIWSMNKDGDPEQGFRRVCIAMERVISVKLATVERGQILVLISATARRGDATNDYALTFYDADEAEDALDDIVEAVEPFVNYIGD